MDLNSHEYILYKFYNGKLFDFHIVQIYKLIDWIRNEVDAIRKPFFQFSRLKRSNKKIVLCFIFLLCFLWFTAVAFTLIQAKASIN